MDETLDNYKMIYIDILKRVNLYLQDAHIADLKYNKSNKKEFSLTKIINQIRKITTDEIKEFAFNDNLNFIFLPNNVDYSYFPRLLLINIINKDKIVFVKKNKRDFFLLNMLIAVSNSLYKEFNTQTKSFFLHNKILKGKQYDVKITQKKTKQSLFIAKSKKVLYFK